MAYDRGPGGGSGTGEVVARVIIRSVGLVLGEVEVATQEGARVGLDCEKGGDLTLLDGHSLA